MMMQSAATTPVAVTAAIDGPTFLDEYDCNLGDAKRTQRLKKIAAVMMEHPEESYPTLFEDEADLEGAYRFFNNTKIDFGQVISGHQAATLERASHYDEVLVLHDTTTFSWQRNDTMRWGLSELNKQSQGFYFHPSLVMTSDGLKCPLGYLTSEVYVMEKDMEHANFEEKKFWKDSFGLLDCKQTRWISGVQKSEALLDGKTSAIHVMDREGDDYAIFDAFLAHGWRFVIRLTHDREILSASGNKKEGYISDALKKAPVVATCCFNVTERIAGQKRPDEKKKHPPRKARQVTAEIRAQCIRMPCPRTKDKNDVNFDHLEVHVVEVKEINGPVGESPIHWMLVTTESIADIDAIFRIINIYRTRWGIEEYFKAIKTGCGYQKRQHDSAQSLLIALAVALPIAFRLLYLRHMERHEPEADALLVISKIQLDILRAHDDRLKRKRKFTVAIVLAAIAKLGGHRKQNGPPGWQTIGRGLEKLLAMEIGWNLAMLQGRDLS